MVVGVCLLLCRLSDVVSPRELVVTRLVRHFWWKVCSCTEGLLVERRDITEELDIMLEAAVSTPFVDCVSNLVEVGSVTGHTTTLNGARHVASQRAGELVFMTGFFASSLTVANVSNATSPIVVGSVVDSTSMGGVEGMVASSNGEFVFVAGYSTNSVAVVNVSDPTSPSVVATVKSPWISSPHRIGMSPNGRYVYVGSCGAGALAVVDVGSPTSPSVVSHFEWTNSPVNRVTHVVASPLGYFAFIASATSDMFAVVNVSDPLSPKPLGIREIPGGRKGISSI